ncbi:hypothetical protein [Candidatus Manganitrophus noduliformans]|uniref:Uncharacterized protein n=1 Tax=Candidatus Manganitrophus noduliformans TaxID=2606439 RepID=A0A7X6DU85_9BACT|nr:hypothetical protein [Candidatus Manganitrophus noduliformans]NKE73512.1 hypothetical protein [Candidatus Manganitrophus noduliformans]
MVRLPPAWVVFFCLLLFGFGELAGALLGGYPQPIKKAIGGAARERLQVHGLTGVGDIDRTVLENVETEALARVHTFHLHAHGLALVVFVLGLIVTNMALSPKAERMLLGLICLGLLYPFGWLTMVFALPFYGRSEAFRLVERFFFIPFGGAFLFIVWGLILLYLFRWIGGKGKIRRE